MTEQDRMEEDEEKCAARLAQQIRMTRNSLPATKDFIDINAEVVWHRFQALRKQGFTDDQALSLMTAGAV